MNQSLMTIHMALDRTEAVTQHYVKYLLTSLELCGS